MPATKPNTKLHSPLNVDPSRTGHIVKQFSMEFLRRLLLFKKQLAQLVDKDDAFYLTHNAEKFTFTSTAEQLDKFRDWVSAKLNDTILGNPETPSDYWWNTYVMKSYGQGQKRAWNDMMSQGKMKFGQAEGFYQGQESQFLDSAFNNPVSVERVKQLAGRDFTELKGVTDTLSQQISRALVDGMVKGKNPKQLVKDMHAVVDKIGKNRVMMIARTETIRAHAEGQLDAMENQGMEEVGVAVEWATAAKPCPLCSALNGIVLKLTEARGMIPRHPNCRCCFIPANVGESQAGQVRSKKGISQAIRDSVSSQGSGGYNKQKAKTTWQGADVKLSKTRPKSILEE